MKCFFLKEYWNHCALSPSTMNPGLATELAYVCSQKFFPCIGFSGGLIRKSRLQKTWLATLSTFFPESSKDNKQYNEIWMYARRFFTHVMSLPCRVLPLRCCWRADLPGASVSSWHCLQCIRVYLVMHVCVPYLTPDGSWQRCQRTAKMQCPLASSWKRECRCGMYVRPAPSTECLRIYHMGDCLCYTYTWYDADRLT